MGQKQSSESNEPPVISGTSERSSGKRNSKRLSNPAVPSTAGDMRNRVSLTLRLSVARAYLDRQQESLKVHIYAETSKRDTLTSPLTEGSSSKLIFTSNAVSVTGEGGAFFGGLEVSMEQLASGGGFGNLEFRIYRSAAGDDSSVLLARSVISYTDLERAGEAAGRKFLFLVFLPSSGQNTFGVGALSVNGLTREYAFADYMKAGLSLKLMAGIDMTRSNGDPRARGSLHSYRIDGTPGQSNEYVPVLESILSVLEEMSGEKNIEFPAYGFGAKLPPSLTKVSHCFSLAGDYFNPKLRGLPGILAAYKEALGAVILHGPTRFSELFKVASGWAEPLEGSSSYLVLVLVTDGAMEDLQETIDVLVTMAPLPVSIIIVGVGDADFSQMERLDGDKHPLVSAETGETLRRDLVQFVRYRDHPTPAALAAAALEELPKQIIKYYAGEKIFPKEGGGFLGTRKKIDSDIAKSPKFLTLNKTDILDTVRSTGYDESIADRIIHEVGVLSPDPLHVLDVMFSIKKRTALAWTSVGKKSIAERLGVEDRLVREEQKAIQQRRAAKITRQNQNIADSENVVQTGVCRVCYTNYIDTVFKPCGHQLVCADCSSKVGKLCPLCRVTIEATVEVGG